MHEDAERPLRVFVRYTHDSDDHRKRVLDLAQRLRELGFDARIDQFVEHDPPHSWPLWMYREIEDADRVVVVCTEAYKRRTEGMEEPGRGLGAAWEGEIITHAIYKKRSGRLCR